MTIGEILKTGKASELVENESGRFDRRIYLNAGGDAEKVPYHDVAWERNEYGERCKARRIFISASWFPDWKSWSRQARAALNAAIGGECDPFSSVQRSSEGYPISGTPHFLVEDGLNILRNPDTAIWINACCPDEQEFNRAVAEAQGVIDKRRCLVSLHGGLAHSMEEWPDGEAPSREIKVNSATIGNLLETY